MKKHFKTFMILILSFLVCLSFSACSAPFTGGSADTDDGSVSRTVYAMDISISLKVWGDQAEQAVEAAEKELHRIDALLSVTDEQSQLAMLNARAADTVSDEALDVITASIRMSELTGGSFDISVYPIVKAWGFTTGGRYRVPDEDEISDILPHIGMDKFTLTVNENDDHGTITFSDPETMLDTGAVTKGYASDRISGILDQYDIDSAIISLGGNILAKGKKPDGSLWHVAVNDPADPDNSYAGIAAVEDRFLVTSGGYQRYFEDETGHRYIHIMDPETGHPVENDLSSVTVISKSGTEADALSTALFVKGLDKAVDFWKKSDVLDFEMILIDDKGRTYITEGLSDSYETSSGKAKIISKK